MFKKGSKIYAIFSGCCPKCHSENMYVTKNVLNFSKAIKMHERCSKCNFKYNMEPSFFFGAMFVSYGLGVLVGLLTFLFCFYLFHFSLKSCFIAIICSLILLNSVIMRLARNIWINIFVHYEKDIEL